MRGESVMNQYKVVLKMIEDYETIVEANNSDEAYRIAIDMDIDEFDETGKITLDMVVTA
jgi:hypothetical protein